MVPLIWIVILCHQSQKWIKCLKCNSAWLWYVIEYVGGECTDRSSQVWSPPWFSWPERRLTTTYTLLLSGETTLNSRSFSSHSLTCVASPTGGQRDESGEGMRGNIGWCSSLQPDTPVCRSGSHFIALKELCERVPTLRKGLSLVSITKSNLQSSQQRVSEDLIHWLRQAWWTKLRLPVQRQGIINGHSSSPSQWQILHTHRENIVNTHTRTGNVFLVSFAFLTKRTFPFFFFF